MREHKFRGKSLDNGWVYGDLVTASSPHITIWTQQGNRVEVIPETVGEFIGLTDKNGVEIYTGDYLRCKQYIGGNLVDYRYELGYVEFVYGAFGLHRKQGFYRPFKDWLEDYELEIIGSIYDNSSLLEGTNA